MGNIALISLFAPLVSFFFAGLFAFKKPDILVGFICSFLVLAGAVSSLWLLYFDGNFTLYLFDWMNIIGVNFSLLIDNVTLVMMCVVGIVSTLVHFYSIFYMKDDEGFNRFFSYLGLFVFSMMVLVMSDNFLGLFVGWEGVGLCSWLLIGFWYQNRSFSFAANEAFIMNRISDLFMLLGIFLIYIAFGSTSYEVVFANADLLAKQDPTMLTLIAAFLFIGAMGKSAQFPFHTWLADAMAGPTPVSALIHAATMVTAGVYLLIRASNIYIQLPNVGYFIAYLGSFVAIFAASMALVNNDLKRIIAYSTLSQLGYMFVAAGVGAYQIALFHLVTHAFFKSLLFLGAGNVMHAMHDELNIKKMGGLWKSMKVTAIFMVVGSLALSGFYPFAGFFSKELILGASYFDGNSFLFIVLLVAAIFTAFYSFRLLMLVFFTPSRTQTHPHEASKIALLAMTPLAVLAVIAGMFEHPFMEFLSIKFDMPNVSSHIITAMATIAALAGALFAIFAYKKGIFSKNCEEGFIYKLLSNDYYFPALYLRVVKLYAKFASELRGCDKSFDELVTNSASGIKTLSSKWELRDDLSLMLKLMVLAFVAILLFIWVV